MVCMCPQFALLNEFMNIVTTKGTTGANWWMTWKVLTRCIPPGSKAIWHLCAGTCQDLNPSQGQDHEQGAHAHWNYGRLCPCLPDMAHEGTARKETQPLSYQLQNGGGIHIWKTEGKMVLPTKSFECQCAKSHMHDYSLLLPAHLQKWEANSFIW